MTLTTQRIFLAGLARTPDGCNDFAQMLCGVALLHLRIVTLRLGQQVRIDPQCHLVPSAVVQFGKAGQATDVSLLRLCLLLSFLWCVFVFFLVVFLHFDRDELLSGDLTMKLLGDIGVVANDDHDGRHALLSRRSRLRLLVTLLPLAGQCHERVLRFCIDDFRLRLAARQLLSRFQVGRDVLPQSEVLRIRPSRIVHRRQPRNLRDAALDRIDQAEIADDPGERGAFRIAAAADVERGRREVDAERHAARRIHLADPRHPDRCFFTIRLRLGAQLRVLRDRRRPVGMVAFVIHDHQRLVVLDEIMKTVLREGVFTLWTELHDWKAADVLRLTRLVEQVPVRHQHLAL